MTVLPHRKNKVSLSDFNYKREIETRLFFSELNANELSILREIVDDSLKIALPEFSKRINIPFKTLQPFLRKLEEIKFLKIEGNFLIVDKEQRKNFEAFISKFDDDFEPGIEYLRGFLNKIPIAVQTQWYHLPRTADNVFQTLIENVFATPKIYGNYIEQLEYDHPLLKSIVKEIFATPDLSLPATKLKQKYKLSDEQFHEIALLLECNLVGCLVYNQNGNNWEERLTPFVEWRMYQKFLADTQPRKITGKVKKIHEEDFAFLIDLSHVLTSLLKAPIAIEKISQLLPKASPEYIQQIIDRILFHHFAVEKGGKLTLKETTATWLKKSQEERALTLSRHPTAVEKGLHRVLQSGWVYVEDFLKGFTGILGSKEKIHLKNKGKKWGYFLPEYTLDEQETIRKTLCERLFEAGFIALGNHQGKICFYVTPFGKRFLEE